MKEPTAKPVNEGAIGWFLAVLNKYAEFSGRASRKEFWYFFLLNNLILATFVVTDHLIGAPNPQVPLGVLSAVYAIATLCPALAVSVRRLHDINLSGWLVLIVFVPLVGGVILLLLYAREGHLGENHYGPSPQSCLHEPPIDSAHAPLETRCGQPDLATEPATTFGTGNCSAGPDPPDLECAVPPQRQAEERTISPRIFCTKCGAKNPADAKYCYSCGSLMFNPDQKGASS